MPYTMTSKQRVLTALAHREPDHVPMDFGGRITTLHAYAERTLKTYLGFEGGNEVISGLMTYTVEPDARLLERFGRDTMPFVFLHPRFLEQRGMSPAIAPTTFVYVDHRRPAGPLFFEDEHTSIETNTLTRIAFDKVGGAMMTVDVSSTEAGREREARVVYLETTNEHLYRMAQREGWTPDVFIGVCDGCRFGGNPGCDNSLDPGRTPLRFLGSPRWWVTEHFSPLSGSFAPGDVVSSPDPLFPARFRKVGLLSPKWGTYGVTMFGATVFEVEPTERGDPSGQSGGTLRSLR